MTEQELQVIKERAEKATAGAWEWKKDFIGSDELYAEDAENIHEIITAGCGQNVGFVRINHDNAEFIAHARGDVPLLIAEVELLDAKWKAQGAMIQRLHKAEDELQDRLDRTELAEAKARMQVKQLTDALQKNHTDFVALAVTAESNQAQLLEQLERLQQTDVCKALEENKRLREALEEIEDSSANDFDGIRLIARQALEG